MGREIRKVPKGWQHPENEGVLQPLYDRDYETEISEWINFHNQWLKGEHPDQKKYSDATAKHKFYAQWSDNPPDIGYYRPKWKDSERTCFQMYETVSEGTPVTPVFETEEALVDYLVNVGERHGGKHSRKAAEAFVKDGWAPSFVMTPEHGIKSGVDAYDDK